ncbi:hypothetical protein RHS03_09088, partial [Rhizoctonia solani]
MTALFSFTSRLFSQRRLKVADVRILRAAQFPGSPCVFWRASHTEQRIDQEREDVVIKETQYPDASDVRYLQRAIMRGDKINPHSTSEPSPSRRRALISGEVINQVIFGFLQKGFTINIMVIPMQRAEMFLEWLVDGTRPADRRFFHFSGHGCRFESKEKEGKQTRVVYKQEHQFGLQAEQPVDTECVHIEDLGKLSQLSIPKNQLRHYIEAIRVQPRFNAESRDEQEWVEDRELNGIFSQLPEGSQLTCVLDCCASGRMINNAIKADGKGFRGNLNVVAGRSLSSRAASSDEGLIMMHEGLPKVEMAMDRITANAYTWAACHQRQSAGRHPRDLISGLFTTVNHSRKDTTLLSSQTDLQIFTEELDLASREVSVEDLFNRVR